MRPILLGCVLVALAACGTHRPAVAPSNGNGTYSTQQPAYGGSADLNGGWTDPAANGPATQGPAQPGVGVTNQQPPPP
ncbi:MAG TPA: hypothetical protein VGG39_10080 [Polyangiaceae bacterium]|jgi:hypothetical protein